MKFTRDGAIWWLLVVVAAAGFLSTHYELVTAAFPRVTMVWQARLELLSALGIFVSGYLRMSPLALSSTSVLAGQGADPSKTLTVTGKEKDNKQEFIP